MKLKEKYILARCCSPTEQDGIVGYFSYDDRIKVHGRECKNLDKADTSRLVDLRWTEIVEQEVDRPGVDFEQLDDLDFRILEYHLKFDIDYSLKVARMLNIDRQTAFDHHRKLRELGLLERVEALMVRYRKKVVDHKWIKHRNHTYYRITPKGELYLRHSPGKAD